MKYRCHFKSRNFKKKRGNFKTDEQKLFYTDLATWFRSGNRSGATPMLSATRLISRFPEWNLICAMDRCSSTLEGLHLTDFGVLRRSQAENRQMKSGLFFAAQALMC
jgi:hypothetical protein